MQKIIIEKPYQFIPPHRGTWWPTVIQALQLYAYYLRKHDGVVDFEIRNADRLRASLNAGHGIMITPNHSRTADPLVMGWLAREVGTHVYGMASWHLFHQGRFNRWALPKIGAFSVNREGVDRQAIDTSIGILESAERPLIVFPEGATTYTNDRLQALLDGVAFIARAAAKKREKRHGGKVVIHPVAIKYFFGGDLEEATTPVIIEIEKRFSWQPQSHLPLVERIVQVGRALLTLKEVEYFGRAQEGNQRERMARLINRLLHPLEQEWLAGPQSGAVVSRVKNLRMQILPDMVRGNVDEAERERRWRQLADVYLAQQVESFPSDYLTYPTVDRLMETVERYEDALNDCRRVHGHLKVVIDVGLPIEVSPQRDRSATEDPIMVRLSDDLQSMLDALAVESPLYAPAVEYFAGRSIPLTVPGQVTPTLDGATSSHSR